MGDHPVPGATLSPGTALTSTQIYALLRANGATAQAAHDLTQIATREDGSGTLNIVNDTPKTGDYSVGLFQINYIGSLLGPRTQQYGSPAALASNPNLQAKAAISLWNNGAGASNWQPHLADGSVMPWNYGTDPARANTAAAAAESTFMNIANGVLASIGLPPIDPNAPPSQQTTQTGGAGSSSTGSDGSGGGGSGTTSTTAGSGTTAGDVKLADTPLGPINIPSGLMLGVVGAVILIVGAIIMLASNKDTQTAIKTVVANPAKAVLA